MGSNDLENALGYYLKNEKCDDCGFKCEKCGAID